jgi:CheY-like chemotaxis protein
LASILVVDDEPFNRLLLATVLRPLGHDVLEAADGDAGLKMVVDRVPDLVVVDLAMPGMGGAGFLKTLRRELRCDVPVVLYTATRPDAPMRDFVELFSISAILEKPSEPADIARVVKAALGG